MTTSMLGCNRRFVQQILILFLPVLLCKITIATAQWQAESTLFTTADSARTGYTNVKNVVAQGNLVHTIWMDKKNGKWRPAYRRSTDGGSTWEDVVHLAEPNTSHFSSHGSCAAHETTVHVIWSDQRNGSEQVYLRTSTDNGASWAEDRCITPDSSECSSPSIATDGKNVHVVYTETLRDLSYIKYIRSTDEGRHWMESVTLAAGSNLINVAIAVVGPVIHTCWSFNYGPEYLGNWDIVYRRSSDGGITWEESVDLSNDPGWSTGCGITASGDDVHVVWHDKRTGAWDIHYVSSRDGGAHWGEDTPIMVTPYDCLLPTLAISGERLHLAWVDLRNDAGDIYYCRSEDAGLSWGQAEAIVSSPTRSRFPHLAVADEALHLLWEDDYKEIRHKWDPTGNATRTHVVEESTGLLSFALDQNFPNPFTEWSNVQFSVPIMSRVRISLHDILGRELLTLLDETRDQGTYTLRINGSQLSAGSYLCRMQTADAVLSRIVTVLEQ
ncbi:exo-alpha-sialidase [bacterium]|nr:exo-alpha-sialidase [bacterium]